jgi:hypothetical protein
LENLKSSQLPLINPTNNGAKFLLSVLYLLER